MSVCQNRIHVPWTCWRWQGEAFTFRKSIPNYAEIAAPLIDLMRKSAPTQVQWTLTCDQAFGKLKEFLCSKLVLNTPDFNRPFILQTDASNRGVQAVLTQIDDNSKEHPIAYYSQKLLSRKERYSVVEKECLAIRLKSPGIQSMPAWTWFTITTACCCLERLEYNNTHLTVGLEFVQHNHIASQCNIGQV